MSKISKILQHLRISQNYIVVLPNYSYLKLGNYQVIA